MARSLSSLWLKSLRTMGKAQRAQSRLIRSVLPKAVRQPVKRRAKPSAVKALAPAKTPKKTPKKTPLLAPKLVRSPPTAAASGSKKPVVARGIWKQSYFVDTSLASSRRMAYWLYLPERASTSVAAPLPLVVMLHGCQQTASDFATATRMNQLAERKGFAVLYPQQSASSDAHRCWHWYKRSVQQGHGEARVIASLIAQVQQRHALDVSRTYVAGLSAGAALAAIVSLCHPELIAAVGLHSAPVFGSNDSAMGAYRTMQHGGGRIPHEVALAFKDALPEFPGMPAIVIHGDRDTVVRHVNADQLSQQLQIINGPSITSAEPVQRSYAGRTGGRSPRHAYATATHYAGRKPQLVQCGIAGLGHAWSGGDDSVGFSARNGPDATLMMWNFFARHRRVAAWVDASLPVAPEIGKKSRRTA